MKLAYEIRCLALLGIIGILLSGCGSGTADELTIQSPVQEDSGEDVPVASWEDVSTETENAKLIQVMGDTIYTADWRFDYDSMRKADCVVSRESVDGDVETIATFDPEQLEYFLVGEDGTVYYVYTKTAEDSVQCCLRKASADGTVVYDNLMCEVNEKEALAEFAEVNCGIATDKGELCLMSIRGKVFLVDAEGKEVTLLETGRERSGDMDAEGIVSCEGNPYLYAIQDGQVALRQVDMERKTIGSSVYLNTDINQLYGIFSGFSEGVYLMDSEGIWNYRFAENAYSQVLLWEDKNVDVNPVFVKRISAMADGGICILYENLAQNVLARVLVEKRPSSEISVKQNITIRLTGWVSDELEATVQKFNLQSENYRVQIVVGEAGTQYQTALLMGQGADIYELSDLPMEELTRLGVLEDLKPYFAESDIVQMEDIVKCVRDAGMIGERFVGIAPEFYLFGLIVPKGTTDNGAWTPEEFLALQEAYPTARLTGKDERPINIFLSQLSYEVSQRIDWENRKCDFNSDSFRKILEGLYRNSKRKVGTETAENDAERLFKKEQLVLGMTVANPWEYVEYREAFEGFGELAGFPNSADKPVYTLYAQQIFGINSASKCKEGSWNFLEFWLSEENQYETNYFPARADVFEEMLALDVSPRVTERGNIDEERSSRWNQYTNEKVKGFQRITDEDRKVIRYMVENAYFGNAMRQEVVQGIFFEELQAYFAGDKTVEAVTDIIQSRITIYLEEME